MNQEIQWKRYAVEAIVIVASILLAFAIDAWWDQRREAIEEQLALRDLEVELKQNLDAIDGLWTTSHLTSFISSVQILRAIHGLPSDTIDFDQIRDLYLTKSSLRESLFPFYAKEVLEALLQEDLLTTDVDVPVGSVIWASRSATYGPSIASLDVLFQSGSVARIQDTTLRSQLTSLPLEINDLIDEELSLRDFVQNEVRPALFRAGNGDLVTSLVPRGNQAYSDLTPYTNQLTAGKTSLQPSQELAHALSVRLEQNLILLLQLRTIKTRYEEILERISLN